MSKTRSFQTSHYPCRRDILAASVGIAGGAAAGGLVRPTRAAAPLRLVAGTRTIEVNGKAASVFRLTGPDGKSCLTLAPGERFNVSLANATNDPTIVHWHGQLPPWTQDGFPWKQTPPIAAGATRNYDYAPIPGTYWMHSHHCMQEQLLMAAPLIVHTAADRREDRQEVVLMLHDFSFRSPEALLADLTKAPVGNGTSTGKGMAMAPGMASDGSTGMGSMRMGSMPMKVTNPASMKMDLNDVTFDAYLANDRTLADPEIVRVASAGRIRLRVINGAVSSQFWLDFGGLDGIVVAVDGHAVKPVLVRRLPLAMAQRVDILLDLPGSGAFPILAQVEGEHARTGIVIATPGSPVTRLAPDADTEAPPVDLSLERVLRSAVPLVPRPVDVHHRMTLSGGMSPYAWSINGEYWPKVTPLMVASGQRVAIDMINQSMMAHPMHLHGHAFQVVALNGTRIAGAVRDTVLVPPMGQVRIAFDANNPGRWAFHCHNLYHMMGGMMTELRYPNIV
ncbi:MAG TPA: multicopper oxidase family protein [Rhodopila sp.]|nr:multicopper oxidase family protein [Rhodopila sp.]